jgi:hypothetical protein
MFEKGEKIFEQNEKKSNKNFNRNLEIVVKMPKFEWKHQNLDENVKILIKM